MSRTHPASYTRLQIALHWAIAVMIFAAWILGDGMGRHLRDRIAAGESGITGNTPHVWLGGAVFALVLVRIVVRLVSGAPAHQGGGLVRLAATWGHRLLYLLMLVVPASGIAAWYFGLPSGDVHETAANALMLVALAHAVMGLFHQFILRDGTLVRMLRPQR